MVTEYIPKHTIHPLDDCGFCVREAERYHLSHENNLKDIASFDREDGTQWITAYWNAERLLVEHLTEAQQATYRDMHAFVVTGNKGGTFVIMSAVSSNIIWITNGGHIHVCVGWSHLTSTANFRAVSLVPDQMLMQKLMLETDERALLKIANY